MELIELQPLGQGLSMRRRAPFCQVRFKTSGQCGTRHLSMDEKSVHAFGLPCVLYHRVTPPSEQSLTKRSYRSRRSCSRHGDNRQHKCHTNRQRFNHMDDHILIVQLVVRRGTDVGEVAATVVVG